MSKVGGYEHVRIKMIKKHNFGRVLFSWNETSLFLFLGQPHEIRLNRASTCNIYNPRLVSYHNIIVHI